MTNTVSEMLRFNVEALNDIETVRIAFENRYRSLTSVGVSENGHLWGQGLSPDSDEAKAVAKIVSDLIAIEKTLTKGVEKTVRSGPLATYIKEAKGLGAKQVARLLAMIGDPYWHSAANRPRTVGELWAYCGLHVIDARAPRHTKGQQGNWNNEARKRAWLIAKSVEKQRDGKYRDLYDATKAHYAGAVHMLDCAQCKAKAGEPMKPGHIQARALRRVAKEVLKDMWIASKAVHEHP